MGFSSTTELPIPHQTKIATCCYCGTRAALVLRGAVRHELSCTSCGAPLHALRHIPVPERAPARRPSALKTKLKRKPHKKKRKSRARDWFEDVWDEIEDFFD